LRHDVVRRIKQSFTGLPVVVNGGFRTADSVLAALEWCDGVMLGREAYHRPLILQELEEALFGQRAREHASGDAVPGDRASPSREALLERMANYVERELAKGERLHSITRHMLGLYAGEPGAREYRRLLSEGVRAPGTGAEILRAAKISRASL
jgi:tRNA-dihydrouridine synthase A